MHHEKQETLSTNPFIHIYNNRINNRLMFKIKCGCKLELQTLEAMNLFGSTNKLLDKKKNGENVPSLERMEAFSVPWHLVSNQCHQKYEVLALLLPINITLIS